MHQGLTQQEYFDLHKRLEPFTTAVARRHFPHDTTQQDEAAFQALSKFVDSAEFKQVDNRLVFSPLIEDIEAWGKTVIVNAIKDFGKVKQPLESMPLPYKELSEIANPEELEGLHGYKVI